MRGRAMIVSATAPGSPLVVAAPAKLNLFLELTDKRPDGYHELESLMLTVDLFDTLELTPNGSARSVSPRTTPHFRRAKPISSQKRFGAAPSRGRRYCPHEADPE